MRNSFFKENEMGKIEIKDDMESKQKAVVFKQYEIGDNYFSADYG